MNTSLEFESLSKESVLSTKTEPIFIFNLGQIREGEIKRRHGFDSCQKTHFLYLAIRLQIVISLFKDISTQTRVPTFIGVKNSVGFYRKKIIADIIIIKGKYLKQSCEQSNTLSFSAILFY